MADLPRPTGLYRPEFEHDACGVAFVVDMHGRRSHRMVRLGIDSLCHMEHRGASGAEVNTGDGAGILIQVPDGFYRAVVPFDLPEPGAYATGIAFLPSDPAEAAAARAAIDKVVLAEGLEVLGWREVPTDASTIGSIAGSTMPSFHQLFVAVGAVRRDSGGGAGAVASGSLMDLERRAFMLRKRARSPKCTAL